MKLPALGDILHKCVLPYNKHTIIEMTLLAQLVFWLLPSGEGSAYCWSRALCTWQRRTKLCSHNQAPSRFLLRTYFEDWSLIILRTCVKKPGFNYTSRLHLSPDKLGARGDPQQQHKAGLSQAPTCPVTSRFTPRSEVPLGSHPGSFEVTRRTNVGFELGYVQLVWKHKIGSRM